MLLDLLTGAIGLLGFGAHALLPWRLVAGEEGPRRRWARFALPTLLLAVLLLLLTGAARPDAAISTGLGLGVASSPAGRAIGVALAGLLLGDALLFFGGPRPEPGAWRLFGVLGGLGLAAGSLGAELLRLGEGPDPGATALLAAALCRAGVGLAAAETFETDVPRLAPLGAIALALYGLTLPPALRAGLLHGGDYLTFGAGAALFALARFLPRRWRRPALLAATLLAAIGFARAAALSAASGVLLTRPLGPLSEP